MDVEGLVWREECWYDRCRLTGVPYPGIGDGRESPLGPPVRLCGLHTRYVTDAVSAGLTVQLWLTMTGYPAVLVAPY